MVQNRAPTPARRHRDDHEQRRLEILRRAAEVFRQKGYHRAGMREIAESLGVAPGALYYYFPSKDDLLHACQSLSLDRLLEGARRIAASEAPADERLGRLILLHLDLTLDITGGSPAHLEFAALPPRLRRAIVKRRNAYEAEVRGVIEAGIREGVFRTLDPKGATLALLGALNWAVVWWRPRGGWSAAEVAASFTDLFLGGLCAAGGSSPSPSPSVPAEATEERA